MSDTSGTFVDHADPDYIINPDGTRTEIKRDVLSDSEKDREESERDFLEENSLEAPDQGLWDRDLSGDQRWYGAQDPSSHRESQSMAETLQDRAHGGRYVTGGQRDWVFGPPDDTGFSVDDKAYLLFMLKDAYDYAEAMPQYQAHAGGSLQDNANNRLQAQLSAYEYMQAWGEVTVEDLERFLLETMKVTDEDIRWAVNPGEDYRRQNLISRLIDPLFGPKANQQGFIRSLLNPYPALPREDEPYRNVMGWSTDLPPLIEQQPGYADFAMGGGFDAILGRGSDVDHWVPDSQAEIALMAALWQPTGILTNAVLSATRAATLGTTRRFMTEQALAMTPAQRRFTAQASQFVDDMVWGTGTPFSGWVPWARLEVSATPLSMLDDVIEGEVVTGRAASEPIAFLESGGLSAPPSNGYWRIRETPVNLPTRSSPSSPAIQDWMQYRDRSGELHFKGIGAEANAEAIMNELGWTREQFDATQEAYAASLSDPEHVEGAVEEFKAGLDDEALNAFMELETGFKEGVIEWGPEERQFIDDMLGVMPRELGGFAEEDPTKGIQEYLEGLSPTVPDGPVVPEESGFSWDDSPTFASKIADLAENIVEAERTEIAKHGILPSGRDLYTSLDPFKIKPGASFNELMERWKHLESMTYNSPTPLREDLRNLYGPMADEGSDTAAILNRLRLASEEVELKINEALGFAEKNEDGTISLTEGTEQSLDIEEATTVVRELQEDIEELSPFDPDYERLAKEIHDWTETLAGMHGAELSITHTPIWEQLGMTELEYLNNQLDFALNGMKDTDEFFQNRADNPDPAEGDVIEHPSGQVVPEQHGFVTHEEWMEIIGNIEDRIVNLLPGVESITGPAGETGTLNPNKGATDGARHPELTDDEYQMWVDQWSEESAALSMADPEDSRWTDGLGSEAFKEGEESPWEKLEMTQAEYEQRLAAAKDFIQEWEESPIWEQLEMPQAEYEQRKAALDRLEQQIWGSDATGGVHGIGPGEGVAGSLGPHGYVPQTPQQLPQKTVPSEKAVQWFKNITDSNKNSISRISLYEVLTYFRGDTGLGAPLTYTNYGIGESNPERPAPSLTEEELASEVQALVQWIGGRIAESQAAGLGNQAGLPAWFTESGFADEFIQEFGDFRIPSRPPPDQEAATVWQSEARYPGGNNYYNDDQALYDKLVELYSKETGLAKDMASPADEDDWLPDPVGFARWMGDKIKTGELDWLLSSNPGFTETFIQKFGDPAIWVDPDAPGMDLVPIPPREVTLWKPPDTPTPPRPQTPLELLQFGMNPSPDPGFRNREVLQNINFSNLYTDYTKDLIHEYYVGGSLWEKIRKATELDFGKPEIRVAAEVVQQFFLSRNSRNTIRARTLVGLESTGVVNPETGIVGEAPYRSDVIDPIKTLKFFAPEAEIDATNFEEILALVKEAIATISQDTLRAAGVGETLTVYRYGDANNRNASVTMYPNLFRWGGRNPGHRWNDPARDELEAYEIRLEDVLVTIDARAGRTNGQAELIVDPAVLDESVTAQNLIRDREAWEIEARKTIEAASPGERIDLLIETLKVEGTDPALLDTETRSSPLRFGGREFDTVAGYALGEHSLFSSESLMRVLNINISDELNMIRMKAFSDTDLGNRDDLRLNRMDKIVMDWDPSLDITLFPNEIIRNMDNLGRTDLDQELMDDAIESQEGRAFTGRWPSRDMVGPLTDREIEIIKEAQPAAGSKILETIRSFGLDTGSTLGQDGRLADALMGESGISSEGGRLLIETDFGSIEVSINQPRLIEAIENYNYSRLSEQEQYHVDMNAELAERSMSGDGDYYREGSGDWFFEHLPSWHPLAETGYELRLF